MSCLAGLSCIYRNLSEKQKSCNNRITAVMIDAAGRSFGLFHLDTIALRPYFSTGLPNGEDVHISLHLYNSIFSEKMQEIFCVF